MFDIYDFTSRPTVAAEEEQTGKRQQNSYPHLIVAVKHTAGQPAGAASCPPGLCLIVWDLVVIVRIVLVSCSGRILWCVRPQDDAEKKWQWDGDMMSKMAHDG